MSNPFKKLERENMLLRMKLAVATTCIYLLEIELQLVLFEAASRALPPLKKGDVLRPRKE